MTDPISPAPAPSAEPKAPVMNTSVPLSQQTGHILKMMEALPERPADAPAGDDNNGDPNPTPAPTPPADPAKPAPETPPADPANPADPTPPAPVEDEPQLIPDADDDDERPEYKPLEQNTWQEYVVKNGVHPIKVAGTQGDKEVVFEVYSYDQLPEDFTFKSEVQRGRFDEALRNMDKLATKLRDDFFSKQQADQQRDFEQKEAKGIAQDIKWLQANGIVPEFKYQENDRRFNDDDAVKTTNAIYEVYKKTNAEYADLYQRTGRSYRISFRDAADKYFAMTAREKADLDKQKPAPAPKPPEKTPIQKQRDAVAGKSGSAAGGEADTAKPRAFKGMSMTDINRLVKAGKI